MIKVKKAVIPAAGLGTRFLPITKAIPKPMLSVFDKPTIQYIAEELNSVGIEDIVIVVSPGSDVIKNHFGENKVLTDRLTLDGKKTLLEIEKQTRKFNVKFVIQEQANGLAGAILCAEQYLNGEPFALLLGDELLYASEDETPCIKKLVDIYENTGKSVMATMEVFGDDLSKYGNVGIKSEDGDVIVVDSVIEKPSINEALSNNAIIGRYVLDNVIFDEIRKIKPTGSEIYLTDAFNSLAKEGKLLATTFEGTRYDVGDKFGFIKANIEYSLRTKEIGEDVKEYIISLAEKLK